MLNFGSKKRSYLTVNSVSYSSIGINYLMYLRDQDNYYICVPQSFEMFHKTLPELLISEGVFQ